MGPHVSLGGDTMMALVTTFLLFIFFFFSFYSILFFLFFRFGEWHLFLLQQDVRLTEWRRETRDSDADEGCVQEGDQVLVVAARSKM
jgi:hypothetical protein